MPQKILTWTATRRLPAARENSSASPPGSVRHAFEGRCACSKTARRALLISDQRLPCMNGAELLEQAAQLLPRTWSESSSRPRRRGRRSRRHQPRAGLSLTREETLGDEDLRLAVLCAPCSTTRSRGRATRRTRRTSVSRGAPAMTRGVVRAIADSWRRRPLSLRPRARVTGYESAIGRRIASACPRSNALAGRPPARRGQDQHARLRPAQARRAHQRERAVVRLHSERGARLLARCGDGGGLGGGASPPEKLRRDGYPEFSRRADTSGLAHHPRRRRLRRDDQTGPSATRSTTSGQSAR